MTYHQNNLKIGRTCAVVEESTSDRRGGCHTRGGVLAWQLGGEEACAREGQRRNGWGTKE
jgi:hypothetical protein